MMKKTYAYMILIVPSVCIFVKIENQTDATHNRQPVELERSRSCFADSKPKPTSKPYDFFLILNGWAFIMNFRRVSFQPNVVDTKNGGEAGRCP